MRTMVPHSQAHVYVMRHCRPGMVERQLEALFQGYTRFHGGCRHMYDLCEIRKYCIYVTALVNLLRFKTVFVLFTQLLCSSLESKGLQLNLIFYFLVNT